MFISNPNRRISCVRGGSDLLGGATRDGEPSGTGNLGTLAIGCFWSQFYFSNWREKQIVGVPRSVLKLRK